MAPFAVCLVSRVPASLSEPYPFPLRGNTYGSEIRAKGRRGPCGILTKIYNIRRYNYKNM
jgi:hypothetical protein